jgi:MFS family permease
MNLLDATIVAVAGPVISTDLGGDPAAIPWLGAAYTAAFGLLLITGGRLGDLVGRRRVFRLGVAGFALASLACALAPTVAALLVARVVQGAMAAAVVPQTIGLIRAMFDGDDRARALGAIGPVMGLAAVCGPLVGGLLTQVTLFGSSWRAVFLVNVPLAVGVLAAATGLTEDRAPVRRRLAALGTVERSLFVGRAFPAALGASTLFFAVAVGAPFAVAMAEQLRRHADALSAGLTVLPWSVGMAVASWVAGTRLVPRMGARLMPVGLAVLLLGTAGAALVDLGGPSTLIPVALGLAGVGQGLFAVPFFGTALALVQPQETGSAAGLLNAVQQLGGTVGVACSARSCWAPGPPRRLPRPPRWPPRRCRSRSRCGTSDHRRGHRPGVAPVPADPSCGRGASSARLAAWVG